MKKFTNLCFAILSIFCSCQGNIEDVQNSTQFQTTHEATNECNYYWYNGKKIELIVDSTKNFIVYNSEKPILKKIKGGEFQKGISTTRSGGQSKASWAIVEKENCTRSPSTILILPTNHLCTFLKRQAKASVLAT